MSNRMHPFLVAILLGTLFSVFAAIGFALYGSDAQEAKAFAGAAQHLVGAYASLNATRSAGCAEPTCQAIAVKPQDLKRQLVVLGTLDRTDDWYPRLSTQINGAGKVPAIQLVDAGASGETCRDIISLGGKRMASGTLVINGSVYDYDKPNPHACLSKPKVNTVAFRVRVPG